MAGRVHPTYRPDKAMNIFKPEWADYMDKLAARWNMKFAHVADLVKALQLSHDYFAANGCVASDHGIEVPYGYQVSEADADAVFQKAMARRALSKQETIAFMSYIFNEVAEMDAAKDQAEKAFSADPKAPRRYKVYDRIKDRVSLRAF